ncbi:MAG: hypothetical protein ACOCV2_07815 [Persicimonas sp.]
MCTPLWRLIGATLSASLLLTSGCYEYRAIEPQELTKVTSKPSGQGEDGTGASETDEAKDGKVTAKNGDRFKPRPKSDVRLRDEDGEAIFYRYPVTAAVDEEHLLIRSEDQAEEGYQVDKLEAIEVQQFDAGSVVILSSSALAIGFMGLLVGSIDTSP